MIKEMDVNEKMSVFKTAEDKSAYLAAYNHLLSIWPVPYDSVNVVTRFGVTHMLVTGPEEGKPLVLRSFRLLTQLGLRLPHLPHWFPFQPSARTILQPMVTDGYRLNERFVELMEATVKHTRTHLLFPTVFSDEELKKIDVPTLLLLGEQEIIYDPEAAVERALRLFPDLEVALVPNASHLLTMQHPATVNRSILEFVGGGD